MVEVGGGGGGGPEHSEHPEWSGRQVGDKPDIMRAENPECRVVGDKCEIMRAKALGASRILGDKWGQVGDKPEITRAENPTCGRELGDKCEIMRTKGVRASSVLGDKWEPSGDKWETSLKSCGQRIQGVVGDNSGTSGRQVQNHVDQSSRIQSVFAGKQARRQTPNHAARACTLSKE